MKSAAGKPASGPAPARPGKAQGSKQSTAAPPSLAETFWGSQAVLGFLVFALVFAVYTPSLRHEFTNYDDNVYVTANHHVRQGLNWANVRWALTATEATNWHPLTWLSHMLDCEIFGLRPWGHHLTNILLHSFNSAFLFFLLSSLTSSRWRSLTVALLFGLHPAHVESVAWVSERKDVLSTAFFLLTIWAYGRYAKSGKEQAGSEALSIPGNAHGHKTIWYAVALGFHFLGLTSKPMLVTLPFVLLLLDFWPLNRVRIQADEPQSQHRSGIAWKKVSRLLLEKVPFLLLALAVSVITFMVQKQEGAMVSLSQLSWDARIQNALVSFVRYLGLLVWPANLAAFYPHPGAWPVVTVILATLLLLALTAASFALRRTDPWLVTGWLWFLGTLVPVIGIVQVGRQAIADRYTYIPFIGLLIAIAWSVSALVRRRSVAPSVSFTLAGLFVLLSAAGTSAQLAHWRNSFTLLQRALAVTRDNYLANIHLGDYFLKERKDPEKAIAHYREAVRQRPQFPEARGFLASALFSQGRLDEAVAECKEAVALTPGDATAHYNYGVALERKGLLAEAIRALERALELSSNNILAHKELGLALRKAQRWQDAARHFRRVTELQPTDAESHSNLGGALLATGDTLDAIASLERAIRQNPDLAEAQSNLGIALCREGRLDEGIRHFETAARLSPSLPEARNNLGIALARKGRRDEAIAAFREALRLRPDYLEAQRQLQSLLDSAGK